MPILPGFGLSINALLKRACNENPAERFESAVEFATALISAIEEQSGRQPVSTVQASGIAHATPKTFAGLRGVCIFCGKDNGPYDPWGNRYCCTEGIPASVTDAFRGEEDLFPTVFPVFQNWMDPGLVPRIAPPCDGLLAAATLNSNPGKHESEFNFQSNGGNTIPPNLTCGHATLHSLGDAANLFHFEPQNVDVCNMGTYPWSSTLKDPKSWAVVHAAVRNKIRHLGLWTAGNAGFSLAKIVNAVNCCLPTTDRITVHCYSFGSALNDATQRLLRGFHARVISVDVPPEGSVFSQTRSFQWINGRAGGTLLKEHFWDVTDGWDGLGIQMYRLLGRQICAYSRPKYILCPVGTGSLLLGLLWGREDCIRSGALRPDECTIIGALPVGNSIIENYAHYHVHIPFGPAATNEPPPAPKLTTTYTPLLLSLLRFLPIPPLDQPRSGVILQQVSMQEFKQTSEIITSCEGVNPGWVSESSALLVFSVLSILARNEIGRGARRGLRASLATSRVVVVNSGCGTLD